MCAWWVLVCAYWVAAGLPTAAAAVVPSSVADYERDPSVQLFREYIRIDTSHPKQTNMPVNYTEAVEFWQRQAESLGLEATVHEYYSGKPIVVITWEGSNTTLPSIMLNSHMDVVAADESQWSHPPFEAAMDADGNIFGRGTQDMKSLSIWYVEAIRRLMADNVTLARTIHMTFVPDEETGGNEGMEVFASSKEFEALNVGFSLDEGQPHHNSSFAVLYGDRTPWQIEVNCTGEGGHGSLMKDDSAGEKIRKVLDSFLDYRASQKGITDADPNRSISSVISINLTKLNGGIGTNILPTSLSAVFDIRLTPSTNQTEFVYNVSTWISEAGCTYLCLRCDDISPATKLEDSNIYWAAFKKAAEAMDLQLDPIVTAGATDMRFLRHRIAALGFAAMTDIPIKAHDKDEYLPADMFLRGIDIFYTIIRAIANV